jgi:glycosyltransferase involved in cell wall biosynthesis
VHHIDDFTTAALIDCQRQAVLEPDAVFVVSEVWRRTLRAEFGVDAQVVHNGVDGARFAPIPPSRRDEFRARVGADGRFLFLAVGGVEPRKGSIHLFEALARLTERMSPSPVLAVIGGQSFQDYEQYRTSALDRAERLGLTLGCDVILLGTVPDADMPAWYRSADALAFPSVKEGFGLAVLEAMSAELPVVASDLPVFREYLVPDRDALMPPVATCRRWPTRCTPSPPTPPCAPTSSPPVVGRRAVQLAGMRRGASGRLRAAAACVLVSRRAGGGTDPAGRGGSAGRCNATTIRHDSVI